MHKLCEIFRFYCLICLLPTVLYCLNKYNNSSSPSRVSYRRCTCRHSKVLLGFYISIVKPTEIKSRLRSGNACYHSVQNLLASRLLSKKLKFEIYRTIILPVGLYGCEAWSLTLREERKLRVLENMVLRRIFGPRSDEVTGGMEETAYRGAK